MEVNQTSPRKETSSRQYTHVDAALSPTHLTDHHAQQGMTTAKYVEN